MTPIGAARSVFFVVFPALRASYQAFFFSWQGTAEVPSLTANQLILVDEAVTMFRSTGNALRNICFWHVCPLRKSNLDGFGSKGSTRAPAWLSYFIL